MSKWLNNKKFIGYLIVLLIILIVIIIWLLLYFKKNNNIQYVNEANGDIFYKHYATTRDSYFDVKQCMNIYLNAINTNNKILSYEYDENDELVLKAGQNEFEKRLYNLLSNNYINKNNITIENINKYVKTIDEQSVFVPLEIAMLQSDSISSFIIHGLIEDIHELKVKDKIYAIVNIDIENNVFSVEPIYENYNNINEIKIKKLESEIKQSDDNKFSRNQTSYEDAAKDYINLYKRISLGYPEKMYELLNEEYRTKRFGTLEDFKKYVKDNKDKIIGIRLEKYKADKLDDYTQYVCIDQYGNYYVFKEKDTLKFTAILDTYTIDLPEFIEKYERATNEEKVKLNIQKIVEALNQKDYKYVYSKLADEFKANYFKTYEDFEKYAQNTFDIGNEVTYNQYTESEKYSTYKITLKGKEKKVIKTIVMRLDEGTDFVMSFNVE